MVSIFDSLEKLALQFSFLTVQGHRGPHPGKAGVYESPLETEAVGCGVLVQAKMTANRRNIDEAFDAYRLLSLIGVDSFGVKPMFASGVLLGNGDVFLGSSEEIRERQRVLIGLRSRDQHAPTCHR